MKREREKHITRLHIILFCLAVIITIVVVVKIKNRSSNNDAAYKTFEEEVVTASKTYITKLKKITIEQGKELRLNIFLLKDANLLQNELADECNGYVVVSNSKNYDGDYETVYEAYISCDGYMTPGYIEEY